MRTARRVALIAPMIGALSAALCPAAAGAGSGALDPALRDRVKASIDVGLKYLRFQQGQNGSWGDSPRATALVLRALAESHRRYNAEDGPFMRRAQRYVAAALESDLTGAETLSAESAATALLALGHSSAPAHRDLCARAAQRLRSRLLAGDAGGTTDSAACAELAPVVEALRSVAGPAEPAVWRQLAKLAWGCGGDAALAGLIAADLGPEPPPGDELAAASGRLLPGAGDRSVPSEHYYLLAAALARHGQPVVADESGASRPWRIELARSLTEQQRFEGSWAPAGGAHTDNDVIVATSFAVLALERIYEDPDGS